MGTRIAAMHPEDTEANPTCTVTAGEVTMKGKEAATAWAEGEVARWQETSANGQTAADEGPQLQEDIRSRHTVAIRGWTWRQQYRALALPSLSLCRPRAAR